MIRRRGLKEEEEEVFRGSGSGRTGDFSKDGIQFVPLTVAQDQ
jgi:hypothetical protein